MSGLEGEDDLFEAASSTALSEPTAQGTQRGRGGRGRGGRKRLREIADEDYGSGDSEEGEVGQCSDALKKRRMAFVGRTSRSLSSR